MEKIGVKQATSKGYIECPIPGCADFAYPESKLRRGRVQFSWGRPISPTITCGSNVCKIIKWERDSREDGTIQGY